MFKRILIANRGEIACRVVRTARAMGVGTVAVYSEPDADALHVKMADMAVPLGGTTPETSYLKGEAIVAAALETGAEAIHPGYGFLSENPDFVEAVEAAGLVFVGPSAKAIRTMGLKGTAKSAMEAAGVPVVPGYHGANQDSGHLASEAARIGYPVLIKAVAGGGGKGMRRVEAPEAFGAALAAARSEALSAFGNSDVLIEKWVTAPRHIEVQIMGNGARAIHLFERDCSLQRRHQKVIEEAPAPGMTPGVRAGLAAAAVRAAEAIGYAGAGTVEFVADGSDALDPERIYFMEMNTRLQVEHPVTEAITGVDLVEWQLRIAAGEGLPLEQEEIALTGHSFEARLYAEDVPAGFLPATGRLSHLGFPKSARADTGVRAGDEISPFYDPMIAKLIVHGPTRDVALLRLRQALAGTEIAGLTTNHSFLRRLAAQDDFASGAVDTGLIDRHADTLMPAPVPCSRSRSLAAIGALGLQANVAPRAGFTLWAPLSRDQRLDWQGEEIDVRVTVLGPGRFRTEIGDAHHEIIRDGARWRIDGAVVVASIHRAGQRVTVFWGNAYAYDIPDPLRRSGAQDTGAGAVLAPMPGLVGAVSVRSGDWVAADDPLLVLEAMKMEHVLRAPRAARIAEVLAAPGDQVEAGATLVTLETEEDTE